MLRLGHAQLRRHRCHVDSHQGVLRHRQLRLLGLRERACGLKPVQRTVDGDALLGDVAHSRLQHRRVGCAGRARRSGGEIRDQIAESAKSVAACRREDLVARNVELDGLAGWRLDRLRLAVAAVDGRRRTCAPIQGERLHPSLAARENVLAQIAGVGQREHLVPDAAQLLGDPLPILSVQSSVIALHGQRDGAGQLRHRASQGRIGHLQQALLARGRLHKGVLRVNFGGQNGILSSGHRIGRERCDANAARQFRGKLLLGPGGLIQRSNQRGHVIRVNPHIAPPSESSLWRIGSLADRRRLAKIQRRCDQRVDDAEHLRSRLVSSLILRQVRRFLVQRHTGKRIAL